MYIALIQFPDGLGATLQADGTWLIDDGIDIDLRLELEENPYEALAKPITNDITDGLTKLSERLGFDIIAWGPTYIPEPDINGDIVY